MEPNRIHAYSEVSRTVFTGACSELSVPIGLQSQLPVGGHSIGQCIWSLPLTGLFPPFVCDIKDRLCTHTFAIS